MRCESRKKGEKETEDELCPPQPNVSATRHRRRRHRSLETPRPEIDHHETHQQYLFYGPVAMSINSLWFKWKSLKLPWRKSFLVGTFKLL